MFSFIVKQIAVGTGMYLFNKKALPKIEEYVSQKLEQYREEIEEENDLDEELETITEEKVYVANFND